MLIPRHEFYNLVNWYTFTKYDNTNYK